MPRILLLDDDLTLLGSIARFLRDEGFAVRVSDQPAKVLTLFEQWRPQLVVTDLKMPDVSGLEVLRSLRQTYPEIPVLLFSAFGTTPDVVEAIELGAVGFIEKTAAPETLLAKMRAAIAGGRAPLSSVPKVGGADKPLNDRVRSFERALIEQALRDTGGRVKDAMAKLGVSRRTLNEKMQRLGIQRQLHETESGEITAQEPEEK